MQKGVYTEWVTENYFSFSCAIKSLCNPELDELGLFVKASAAPKGVDLNLFDMGLKLVSLLF